MNKKIHNCFIALAYISVFMAFVYIMYQVNTGNIDWSHQTLKQAIAINILGIMAAYLSYYAWKQHLNLLKRRKANNTADNCADKIANCHAKATHKVLDTLITQDKSEDKESYRQNNPADVFKKIAHFLFPSFNKVIKNKTKRRVMSRDNCLS
jgi:hypothetical protein